jgi:malonyl-CoA O-methyltransferase
MKIQREFSQNANDYEKVNIIQRRVVHALLSHIGDSPENILDIGCGSGAVYKALSWPVQTFVGVDFAEGMLSLHPKDTPVTLLHEDFNDPVLFEKLHTYSFDRIISSSALQWASDLDATLGHIAALGAPVSLAIFTSNTFKTLYDIAGLPPILRDREEVITLLKKHFSGKTKTLHYTLSFDSVREMFRYMKQSGVGAGRNVLGYKEMKRLMEAYPLDHLEYEIVLMHEDIKRSV